MGGTGEPSRPWSKGAEQVGPGDYLLLKPGANIATGRRGWEKGMGGREGRGQEGKGSDREDRGREGGSRVEEEENGMAGQGGENRRGEGRA